MIERLGRMGLVGFFKIFLALGVLVLELLVRCALFLIPSPLLGLWDRSRAKSIFPNVRLFRAEQDPDSATMDMTTPELLKHFGYDAEEHVVQTEDGYLLTLHRIVKRSISDSLSSTTPSPDNARSRGPPVFVMHGLMQSSEAWVCFREALPFTLVDSGYDVWLGNNRGNKYSCKHIHLKPHDAKFWDFSLDEFARFDVPAAINYVLRSTAHAQLTYIGFSQGTAQAFAAFSLNPEIASKVKLFVALAPAAKARGLRQGMLQTFVNIAPHSLYLIFGTRAILTSVLFWRVTLTRSLFARVIDMSCRYLFDWHMENMGSVERKRVLYAHLYSYCSVKTVVHWFQIAIHDTFQEYDENEDYSKSYRGIHPQGFPLKQIQCPVALFYGTADELTDMKWLESQIPSSSPIHRVEGYEHIDMMWGVNAPNDVFKSCLSVINKYNA